MRKQTFVKMQMCMATPRSFAGGFSIHIFRLRLQHRDFLLGQLNDPRLWLTPVNDFFMGARNKKNCFAKNCWKLARKGRTQGKLTQHDQRDGNRRKCQIHDFVGSRFGVDMFVIVFEARCDAKTSFVNVSSCRQFWLGNALYHRHFSKKVVRTSDSWKHTHISTNTLKLVVCSA